MCIDYLTNKSWGQKVMSEVSDGRTATIEVRKYFEQTHGPLGVIGFEVDDVTYLQDRKAWSVKCRFFTSWGSMAKTSYEVMVSEDGKVLEVKKAS